MDLKKNVEINPIACTRSLLVKQVPIVACYVYLYIDTYARLYLSHRNVETFFY